MVQKGNNSDGQKAQFKAPYNSLAVF